MFQAFYLSAVENEIIKEAEFMEDDFFAAEDGKFSEEKDYLNGPYGMYFVNDHTFHLYSRKLKEDRYFTRQKDGSYSYESFPSEYSSFRTTSRDYEDQIFLTRDFLHGIKEEDKYLFEDIHRDSNSSFSLTDDGKGLLYFFYIAAFPDKDNEEKIDLNKSKGVLIIKDTKSYKTLYRTFSFENELNNSLVKSENIRCLFEINILSAADKKGNFYFFNLTKKENKRIWQLTKCLFQKGILYFLI